MFKNIISAIIIASQLATGSVSPIGTEPVQETPDCSYIIHAAGEIDSSYSTNSREALRNAYNNGNRVIEIDFSFSADGIPVCVHDWNEAILPGTTKHVPSTLDQFTSNKIYGKFTPMTLLDVVRFMTMYPDLYIVTDVKDNNIGFCEYLSQNYPELSDRFIIQVYSEDEYMSVLNLGFKKIIFTLYNLDWETKTSPYYLVAFSRQYPIFAFTFPHELCAIEGYVQAMMEGEVPLFVHTVNDKELQQKYFDMGISGIYTDNTIHK